MSNLLLVYGRKFLPYRMLKKVSDKRNVLIEKKILDVVGPLPSDEDMRITPNGTSIIWFCWLQGEDKMPLIPRLCLESIRKNSNGHDVVVITESNLSEYICISDKIIELYKKGNITAAHFSDIIRLGLLDKYGGFWIDSTMYLTKPIDDAVFTASLYSMKSEPEGFYVSECRWAGFCFRMSQESRLPGVVNKILLNYWEKEEWLIDYFMIDYLFDIAYRHFSDVKDDIDAIPFNNPELHKLCPKLCDDFNEEEFNRLTENTSFFKLSWKAFSSEQLLDNPANYYHHLKALAGK